MIGQNFHKVVILEILQFADTEYTTRLHMSQVTCVSEVVASVRCRLAPYVYTSIKTVPVLERRGCSLQQGWRFAQILRCVKTILR
jgi:hypothetical protein